MDVKIREDQEILYRKALAEKIERLKKTLTSFCLVGRKEYINEKCPNNKRGLNFASAINTVLNKEKTKIPESVIENNIKGANILLKNNKINDEQYNKFVDGLQYKYQVFNEGEWHPVNKLNTNYIEISILLSDLLIDTYIKNKTNEVLSKKLKSIFMPIMSSNSVEEIKNILMDNKDFLRDLLINTYKQNPRELFDYTKNIIKKSEIGEIIENDCRKFLESDKIKWGFEYQGGNGDFIDMKFSVDLIMKDTEGVVKTIQVKSTERDAAQFRDESISGLHQAVDMVVFPKNGEYLQYNLK
jgi:hypothetical protein